MADSGRMAQTHLAKLDVIRSEVDELLREHEPVWASEEMKQRGREPIGCRICFPHDGHWPCSSRLSAEIIANIIANLIAER